MEAADLWIPGKLDFFFFFLMKPAQQLPEWPPVHVIHERADTQWTFKESDTNETWKSSGDQTLM